MYMIKNTLAMMVKKSVMLRTRVYFATLEKAPDLIARGTLLSFSIQNRYLD